MEYTQVIGLEVHCELKTNTKMFSASPVSYGLEPNTMVNEVDLSMPGTLPTVNKKAVEYAIRVCHVLHLEIDELLCFDRKNYYYSDLPKGFQITQQARPIGKNGYLEIEVNNHIKRIEIERLHLEEDTAKQEHIDDYTLIDYNRAGIPLIEIVTKPVIENGLQASLYLEKLRQVLIYTDVSDAKMSEGSMRCDVNISVKPFGSQQNGTRCEIKNLNSISNVQKAIDYEASRQIAILNQGQTVIQQTRRFDETLKQTVLMRSKENAVDYKYYREPNILPIKLDHQWVIDILNQLPMMMDERLDLYINYYHLPKVDAHILVSNKQLSDFFNETIKECSHYKLVSNWLLGDISAYLNKYNIEIYDTKLTPHALAVIINEVEKAEISNTSAKKVFEIIMDTGKDPIDIIEEYHFHQISDENILRDIIHQVLSENPQSVNDYRNGKKKAKGYLVGQIMKKSQGKANPKIVNQILIDRLDSKN